MAYDAANPNFTIKWFLGDVTSDAADEIAACAGLLTCTIRATAVAAAAGDKPEPFTVSLLVRDDTSPNMAESSDVAQATIGTGTFLPAVNK